MQYLKRLVSRLTHAGVRPELPAPLARRILTMNRIALTIFFVTCPYVWIFHAAGAHLYGNLVIYIATAYLAFIAMNAAGHYTLSRLAMLVHFNLAVFTYSSIFGEDAGIHLCFFLLVCLPLTIFELKDRGAIAFGMLLPVAGYVVAELTDFSVLPRFTLTSSMLAVVYWAIVISNFAMLGVAVLYSYLASEQSERGLRQEKLLADGILDTTSALIALVGLDGRLVRFNRACERLTGYRADELVGTDHSGVLVPDEDLPALRDARAGLLAGEENVRMCNRWRTKDGRLRVIDWIGNPLLDADDRVEYLLVTGIDITERVEAERLVADQQAKLMTAAKMSALGEMASGIAHEVNNPLAVIQLKADQLVSSSMGQEITEIGQKIDSMVGRISKIIQALRGFAREGRQDPFEPVRVELLLEDVLGLCREKFRNHGVSLKTRAPETPLRFEGRLVEISQVVLNLLNNSFDAAMERETGRWIELEVEDAGPQIRFAVTDSGAGIEAKAKSRLFEPFFTTKPHGKGTGLGLSISRSIAEAHRGSLVLDDSHPHTRFVLSLPKKQRLASHAQ